MKLEGTYTLGVPRQVAWNLLNDPAVLARAIPGCERLTATGENTYEAVIKAGVASIRGTYTGTVAIEDAKPPESYTLRVQGKGTGGFIQGRATITLFDKGAQTEIKIGGEAQIGGLIAGIGSRLLDGAGKMMLEEFFKKLEAEAKKVLSP